MQKIKHTNKRQGFGCVFSLFILMLAGGEFCFALLRSIEDLDQINARSRRLGDYMPGDDSLWRTALVKQLGRGGPGRLVEGVVQGIAQDELDTRFIAGEAQDLRLGWGYQQVDYLNLQGFSFSVPLNICTG